MPIPRLTGVLNNCALNSALPLLLDGIQKLAEHEVAGTLANIADNLIVQRYVRLKVLFASHYGIGKNPAFNWQELHAFVTTHSFYANELMFAPILRNFIAEIGCTDGYAIANLGLLRDIQVDGRYNYLHYLEAANLLHNQFGISVSSYEYIENRETGNPKDNYNLLNRRVTINLDYPFGETPMLHLYFKDDHFEIQPHESLADANRAYDEEVNGLPQVLADIHDGLSISQSVNESSKNLGLLVLYVHDVLMVQLAAASQRKLAECGQSVPQQERMNTTGCQDHLISAETYATTGRVLHGNSPAGRQTFAVILLILLLEQGDKQAKAMLAHLDNLAFATHGHEPLASYLLDNLATAIIKSKADLSAASVTKAVYQIKQNHLTILRLSAIEKSNYDEQHVHLVKTAKQTIKKAWQRYQETNDMHLIAVIKQTQAVASEPTLQNIKAYDALREQVSGKGSWGKTMAGLMLSILGMALVVGAILGLVGSAGAAIPFSLPAIVTGVGKLALGVGSIAAGMGFFSAGSHTGLYLEMKKTSDEATEQLPIYW